MDSSAQIDYPAGMLRDHAPANTSGREASIPVSLLEHFNYPIILLNHLLEPIFFNRAAERSKIIVQARLETNVQKQVASCFADTCELPTLVRIKNSSGVFPTIVQPITGIGATQYLLTSAAAKSETGSNVKAVAAAYRLTTTEVRILRQLLDGQVPKQIAVTHQVALSTIRTQIKHILQKTGLSSVVDLVLFVKSMPDINDQGSSSTTVANGSAAPNAY